MEKISFRYNVYLNHPQYARIRFFIEPHSPVWKRIVDSVLIRENTGQ